ncbi:OsmC family protein [Ornithinicoccus hortensis]|uniref:Organic hydroperoxide reductase OsmC/OhrA n=1 Tax=Ornithinicoccus hortensis TaxID=82346 RepID=A0A542YQT2_9MICO|nr:OsmC family protein [Ornithinicoccus hortensis]TQL50429.1 organic hydroperoxide reductase OsmC/OhrA [Ornithinicoccus hortensis]
MLEHTFPTTVTWSGSTAEGLRHYTRNHTGTAGPGLELELTADPHFRGVADRLNPEQLVVLAASSCQMLSFLAVAARERLDVVAYTDDALGRMPMARTGMRISTITLRPRIVLAAGSDTSRIAELTQRAHEECFIANSLNSAITVEPVVEIADPEPSTE